MRDWESMVRANAERYRELRREKKYRCFEKEQKKARDKARKARRRLKQEGR